MTYLTAVRDFSSGLRGMANPELTFKSPIVYVSSRKIFGTAPKSNFAEVCPLPSVHWIKAFGREGVSRISG